MGKALSRLNADLMDCGIEIEFDRTRNGRLVTISKKVEDVQFDEDDKVIAELIASMKEEYEGEKCEMYRSDTLMWDIDADDEDE